MSNQTTTLLKHAVSPRLKRLLKSWKQQLVGVVILMPDCNGCGAFVTPLFVRVFGNNDNDVYGCHDCLSTTELTEGQTSGQYS